MPKSVLSEFQNFLLSRHLVPEKKVSYYIYWVRSFLSFSQNQTELNADLRVKKFLNQLNQTIYELRLIIVMEDKIRLK